MSRHCLVECGPASITPASVEVVPHSMHLPCSKPLVEDTEYLALHAQLTANQLYRFAHTLSASNMVYTECMFNQQSYSTCTVSEDNL